MARTYLDNNGNINLKGNLKCLSFGIAQLVIRDDEFGFSNVVKQNGSNIIQKYYGYLDERNRAYGLGTFISQNGNSYERGIWIHDKRHGLFLSSKLDVLESYEYLWDNGKLLWRTRLDSYIFPVELITQSKLDILDWNKRMNKLIFKMFGIHYIPGIIEEIRVSCYGVNKLM